jgi:3-methyladenine DNA glycosylase AlkD
MTGLANAVHDKLREAADPPRAPGMQAYMKSAMAYLGVSTVPLRQVCKSLFAGLAWPTAPPGRRTCWRSGAAPAFASSATRRSS